MSKCLLCDELIVPGSKSFGTIGGQLCYRCYFAFPYPPSLEEQNKQFREAFSEPSEAQKKQPPLFVDADVLLPGCLVSCPFTRGRLDELYWTQKKTLREIGEIAAEMIGRENPFSCQVVSKWFKAHEIKTGKRGLVNKRYGSLKKAKAASLKSEKAKEASRENIKIALAKVADFSPAKRKAIAKKIAIGVAKAHEKKRVLNVTCAYCGTLFYRPEHLIRKSALSGSKQSFCNQSCVKSFRKAESFKKAFSKNPEPKSTQA